MVDFRNQSGIYCLYDDAFKLIYVGQAGRGNQKLFNRLKFHCTDHLSARWSKFAWFGIYPTIGENEEEAMIDESAKIENPEISNVLNHMEAVLIHSAEPPLNRQGGRFGDIVEQYLQCRDDEYLDPPTDRMIKEIYDSTVE